VAGLTRVAATMLGVSAAMLALLDARFSPAFYARWHLALAALVLVALAGMAHALWARPRARRAVVGATASLWALVLALSGGASTEEMTDALIRRPTVHRRVWVVRERMRGTFPRMPELVAVSEPRDLWPTQAGLQVEPRAGRSDARIDGAEARPGFVAPRLVLLVTIDAFRCGFGQMDRPELRDACPELTRLLGESRYRLDAHATSPSTLAST